MGEVLFNTNEVANMLQVDKSTVKRWTDEGKLKCFRTPGGHRKFRADDVYSFMSSFNYGVSTLQVLPQLASDEVIIKRIVQNKEFSVLSSVCFNAAIKGKKDEILTLFIETYRAGMSVAAAFDHILRPSLKKINDMHASNKISFTEYQLAHNALSSAVVQLQDSVQRSAKNNRVIVCASLEQERNDVESKALVTLFEIDGFTVLNLGTGVSADAVNHLVFRTKPFAVCLYSCAPADTEKFVAEVEKVLHATKDTMTRLVVGGKAFEAEAVRENFVGIRICPSFQEFALVRYHESAEEVRQYDNQ
ncbi:MAG: helix-turn-helix domain-containing protein [Bacteroidetes bacterium]|nr:MAG: helix-turn-helix domain-containing protein [Bacteroidota bacterium]